MARETKDMMSNPRSVRNLGIFKLNLIQKYHSKFMTICMCTCVKILLADVANMNTNSILIIAKKMILNLTKSRIELYTAEGPMLKAPVAPFALVAIVRCLRSRTTVDAGRCLQCRPSNVHQKVDDPRKKKTSAVTKKKRAVMETLPKNLIAHTPKQVSLCRWQFRRPALTTFCAHRGLGRGNLGATQ